MPKSYDKWPDSPHWTIISSLGMGDLDKGDQVTFALDTTVTPAKIYIASVTCPGGTVHATAHTGASVKGARCSGSGNRATGGTFVIESSTDPATNKEMLTYTCGDGGIMPISWTAIDGSGSSTLKKPKPPKPPRTPRTL
jgi:hypothetical protein